MAHSAPDIPLGVMIFSLGVGGSVMRFAPRAVWWVSIGFVLMMAGTCGREAVIGIAALLGITRLAMYFFGAVGLYCSARSVSSWKSLLGTIILGYAGVAVLWCVGLPVGCIASMILTAIAGILEHLFSGNSNQPTFIFGRWSDFFGPFALTLGSAFVLWKVGRSVLASAENIISKRDRIAPEWVRMIEYDLPRYGRRRPPLYRRS
jgi:hypothetical protein